MSLQDQIKKINEMYGKNVIKQGSELQAVLKVPMREPILDYVLGGGLPTGRIIEFLGDEHTGKTRDSYVALERFQHFCFACGGSDTLQAEWENSTGFPKLVSATCSNCENPRTCIQVIIDYENTTDKDFLIKYFDVDLNGVLFNVSDTPSMLINTVETFLRSPEIGLIIVDSMGSISSDAEIDSRMEDIKMNSGARNTNTAVRKWQAALNFNSNSVAHQIPTTCIVINREYETLSIYSAKVPQGGRGLRHAKSISISRKIKEKVQVKTPNGDVVVGIHRLIESKKNKAGMPYRKGEDYLNLDINNPIGYVRVDRASQIVDIALQERMVKSSGGWFQIGDDKFHGRAELMKEIDNTELPNKIDLLVYGKSLATSAGKTKPETKPEAGIETGKKTTGKSNSKLGGGKKPK